MRVPRSWLNPPDHEVDTAADGSVADGAEERESRPVMIARRLREQKSEVQFYLEWKLKERTSGRDNVKSLFSDTLSKNWSRSRSRGFARREY